MRMRSAATIAKYGLCSLVCLALFFGLPLLLDGKISLVGSLLDGNVENIAVTQEVLQSNEYHYTERERAQRLVLPNDQGIATSYPLLPDTDAIVKRRAMRLRERQKIDTIAKRIETQVIERRSDRRIEHIQRDSELPRIERRGPAQAGGVLPRPDIAIKRDVYPLRKKVKKNPLKSAAPTLIAQSNSLIDTLGTGYEGQMLMMVDGLPQWTDLPYREQLLSMHHSASRQNSGGGSRRGGGGGGGGSTNVTNVTNTTVNQAFGWAESADGTLVYLSNVTDLVGIGTTTPETKLEVVGTMSGASLVVSNLRNCDTIDTDANGVLVCGTDDGGAGSLSQSQADNRYVNTSGDTMTGALVVLSNGQFSGYLTGSVVQASSTLASSGNLVIEGNARINGAIILGGVTYNFPVGDGAASGRVLATDGNGQLSWTEAGSGDGDLTLADANERFVLVQGDTMTGGLLINLGGSALEQIESGLAFEVVGAISGSTIHAQNSLTSSGTLVVEGNATFNSGVVLNGTTYTFPVGDGSSSGKVLKTDSNGQLTWSDDLNTGQSYYAGQGLGLDGALFTLNSTLSGSSLEFTTISGATLHAESSLTSSGILVAEGATYLHDAVTIDGVLTLDADDIAVYDANPSFSSDNQLVTKKYVDDNSIDTNTTYTPGEGIDLSGTIFSLGDTISGSSLAFTSVSGATLAAQDGITTSGSVIVESDVIAHGLLSGSQIEGAGLYDCDGVNDKLVWDVTTKTFSCASDNNTDTDTTYSAGQGLSLDGTLFTLQGSLSGSMLDFVTISGATLHAADLITSSGSMIVESNLTVHGVMSGSTFFGAGLHDCDGANDKVVWDSATGQFSCAADNNTDTDTTYSAGEGLGLNGTVFSLNDTITGSLIDFVSISGATVFAQDGMTTSGSLVVEGSTVLNGTVTLNGVTYTFPVGDGSASGKVLKTDGSGQLSWSDDIDTDVDTDTTYSAGEGLGLDGTVFSLNDTITGSVLEFGTVSGAIVHGQSELRSSGSLVVENASVLHGAVNINGVLTLDADDIAVYDANPSFSSDNQIVTKKYVDDNDTDTTYSAGQGLSLDGTLFTLQGSLTGSMLDFVTISGATLHAADLITSSGSMIVESNLTVHGVMSGSTLYGAGLYDCDGANDKLVWDSATGQFSCAADNNTDTDTTYSAGEGLGLNGTVFSLNDTITGSLLEFDTVSGAIVHGQSELRSSGSLVVEGVSTLQGAVNINGVLTLDADDIAVYDANPSFSSDNQIVTKKYVDDNDTDTTYSAGQGLSLDGTLFTLQGSLTGSMLDFVTISGATLHAADLITSSGSMIVESNLTVHGVMSGSTFFGAGLYDCDGANEKVVWDSATGQFSCAADQTGGSSITAGQGLSLDSDVLSVNGTLTGSSLSFATISGGTLHAESLISTSGALAVEGNADIHGTLSGNTIEGFGLTNCTGGNKLLWNATTETFECGVDQSAGSGLDQNSGDARYVNQAGDTMTGGLLIHGTNDVAKSVDAGVLLEISGTASGSSIHAQDTLSSSGVLVVNGIATIRGTLSGNTIAGFNLTDCQGSGNKLVYNASAERFECAADENTDTDTTYSAGEGLGLDGTVFSLNDTITGSLLEFSTVSGAIVHGQSELRSSGSLVVEGVSTLQGAVNINGVLTLDADDIAVYDANPSFSSDNQIVTKKYVDDNDTDTTYSAGEGLGLDGTVFSLNDTITGSLIDFVSISGATVFAQDGMTTSGSLVVESDVIAHGLLSGSQIEGAGLYDCDGVNDKLVWDVTTKTFSCASDNNTDTDTTYSAGQGLSLDGTLFTLQGSLTGSMLDFVTISGATLHAADLITSSGSMIVESNLTVHGVMSGSTLYGAGLYDCDGANDKLVWDSATGQFSCAADQTGGSSITAGQGLSLDSDVLSVNGTLTGSSLSFATISGGTLHAETSLTSSGVLSIEGSAFFASLLRAQGGLSGASLQIDGTATINQGLELNADTIGDATLTFGNTLLDETLIFNATNHIFTFSDDVHTTGNLTASGTLTIDGQSRFKGLVRAQNGLSGSSLQIDGTSSLDGLVTLSGAENTELLRLSDSTNTDSASIFVGSGSPQAVVVAQLGSLYMDHANGALYVKDSIDGQDDGWVQVATGGGGGGMSYADGSSWFVNTAGDTMTGGLLIHGTNDASKTADDGVLLEVSGTMSGRIIHAQDSLTSSGQLIVKSTVLNDTGAAVIKGVEYQTGAYIYGSGAAALTLDVGVATQTGSSPHIAFGYNDYYDVRLYRTGHQGSGGLVLHGESGSGSDSIFKVVNTSTDAVNDNIFRISGGGNVYAEGTFTGGGADYAEWFYATDNDLVQGELVCIDIAHDNAVQRCRDDADGNLMGIVSSIEQASFIGNAFWGPDEQPLEGYELIGLIGQLKTRVSNQNGPIRPGDAITSTADGRGMRANAEDPTVGIALEGMDSDDGYINVLIARRNSSVTVDTVEEEILKKIADLELEDELELISAAHEEILAEINDIIEPLRTNTFSDSIAFADSVQFASGAYITGALVLNGDVFDPASLRIHSGSIIDIASLTIHDALHVMGDITIEGLAIHLSDVHIAGNLIMTGAVLMNEDQAGFAIIPKTGTAVTVAFVSGYDATPIVTASADAFVRWRIQHQSVDGFTIELSDTADQDVTFSWHALYVQSPQRSFGENIHGAAITPFPVDANGVPLSSSTIWNGCIRNQTPIDPVTNKPFNCSRYRDDDAWTHPDLLAQFIWNTNKTPKLIVPEGYSITFVESPEDTNDVEEASETVTEDLNDEAETEIVEVSEEEGLDDTVAEEEFENIEDAEEANDAEDAEGIIEEGIEDLQKEDDVLDDEAEAEIVEGSEEEGLDDLESENIDEATEEEIEEIEDDEVDLDSAEGAGDITEEEDLQDLNEQEDLQEEDDVLDNEAETEIVEGSEEEGLDDLESEATEEAIEEIEDDEVDLDSAEGAGDNTEEENLQDLNEEEDLGDKATEEEVEGDTGLENTEVEEVEVESTEEEQ